MKPNPVHRLPAPLEAAIQRVKLAAREAVERTIESLGLAAIAAHNAYQRDGLLGAQIELNRKSAVFALTFNEAYDQRVMREIAPAPAGDAGVSDSVRTAGPASARGALADWANLSLVEDQEVEAQISGDRFGMEIAHSCEWELRELDTYISSLLAEAGGERDRNPLRPDLIGHAMIRGIAAVSEREDVRKLLSSELSRSLGGLLRAAYADIVAGFRNAGVQPVSLTVRNRQSRHSAQRAGESAEDAEAEDSTGSAADSRFGGRRSGAGTGAGFGAATSSGSSGFGMPSRGGVSGVGLGGGGAGLSMGTVDPALMSLIRRINHDGGPFDDEARVGLQDSQVGQSALGQSDRVRLPRNLIRAHREELRRATSGSLDHMVIDVIGFMFDQILADPKVPPQLARQIARLQLPVLRAALGDKTFFSSRRHPVRRFINRIASLGSAFDDFEDPAAQGFLAQVRALVQEVAEGDFDRIETYEQQLSALEAAAQSLNSLADSVQQDAATLLAEREDEQRLHALYAQRMAGGLKDVDAPPFLRDFLATVWSQVLLRAAGQGGPGGTLAIQMRSVARELFLSVQPKATAAHRKAFLAELPRLMQSLSQGMDLIGWPEAQRREFFGRLMPAHAEALKAISTRTLDVNLMVRRVEGVLQSPPPSRAELGQAPASGAEVPPPVLTADEARRVGLVAETAVNWDGRVDIEVGSDEASPDSQAGSLLPGVPGLPASTEAAEPTEGAALAGHLTVGYPYKMHLDDRWQKVRLTHISPGRNFFIFTHGSKDRKTVSMTQRMLLRLCESGRLKAFEASFLVERATARARRQLAALGPQAH
jgi:hypothetical protein